MLSTADLLAIERELCERSFAEFVKRAWPIVEPGRPLLWNWHLDTICGYLEAVDSGCIRRIIFNVPPGTMKSLVVSVFFPAWKWTKDPAHRFLCGSNEGTLATRDALRMRTIVESDWYTSLWGGKFQISRDQREKTLFANTSHGHRESQGVLGKVTGKRGDCLIWDDPHDTKQTESDVQRSAVLEAWDTAWSSRLNDPRSSAVILIMQRIHQLDITGHLKTKEDQGWVVLAIPMRYDSEVTFDAERDIGRPELNDPRTMEGELLFPERFDEAAVRSLETDLGAYGSAGQLQQRPTPKGGGEFRTDWLRFYSRKPAKGNRVILVDPAGSRSQSSRKTRRDNTAMGVWQKGEDDNWYLVDGYRDRITLVERANILFRWHRQYRPLAVFYERYGMQSDIDHLMERMEQESYRFNLIELGGSLSKEDRIRKLLPLFSRGQIWLPEVLYRTNDQGLEVDIINAFIEEEYKQFPVATKDDFFDMMARLCDKEVRDAIGRPQVQRRVQYLSAEPVDPDFWG